MGWYICLHCNISAIPYTRISSCCVYLAISNLPPPPLRKHQESQESDGQTGSWCLDKGVLARNARYQKNACAENLPIPHPRHNSHNRALEHNA